MKQLWPLLRLALGLNLLFVVAGLMSAALPRGTYAEKFTAAFAGGDLALGAADPNSYRLGFDTFSDCAGLVMLLQHGNGWWRTGISPQLPLYGHPCETLKGMSEGTFPTDKPHPGYHQYWHGHRVFSAFALQVVPLGLYRKMLQLGCVASLLWAAYMLWRRSRRAFAALAPLLLIVLLGGGFDRWGQSLTHTWSLALPWLFLGFLLKRGGGRSQAQPLLLVSVTFGTLAAFVDLMSGALLWGAAFALWAPYIERRIEGWNSPRAVRVSLQCFAAFCGAAVLSLLLKQGVALFAQIPGESVIGNFSTQLKHRIDGAVNVGGQLLLEHVSLSQAFDHYLRGWQELLHVSGAVWLLLLTLAFASLGGTLRDIFMHGVSWHFLLPFVGACLAPLAWMLLFKNHTYVHWWFVGRFLTPSLGLLLALFPWAYAMERGSAHRLRV